MDASTVSGCRQRLNFESEGKRKGGQCWYLSGTALKGVRSTTGWPGSRGKS